ncbi:cyclase family protein [Candidatus Gottesmanbacteria bacterium]|nr:cyclase family protein [Candidatus Gottesmanbacteria bacterium]
MKIIDLTQPLFDGMEIYPGDPEVRIKEIHTLEKEGWRLKLLSFSSHIGTHVNVPYHMAKTGKTLDDLSLDNFAGECVIYEDGMDFDSNTGVIFKDQNIDQKITDKLIINSPRFIGLSAKFEFNVDLEKSLLEKGIISFENLVNTEELPNKFFFYGAPLKIKNGDGSPVRAFVVLN